MLSVVARRQWNAEGHADHVPVPGTSRRPAHPTAVISIGTIDPHIVLPVHGSVHAGWRGELALTAREDTPPSGELENRGWWHGQVAVD